MTSPNSAKLIKSLHQKKHRQDTKKFLVEGTKNVLELLSSDYVTESVYATKEFLLKHESKIPKTAKVFPVEAGELKAYGTLEHNDGAIAIVKQKLSALPKETKDLVLALDDVRDPGNLGTIIRIADWYGVTDIVCSETCVDWYNPKVIAASMGSFARVNGHYTDLKGWLKKQKAPVIGTFLSGTSAHEFAFPESAVLVIGSESHGISKEIEALVTNKITIPRYGKAESLNAAIATAIVLDRSKK